MVDKEDNTNNHSASPYATRSFDRSEIRTLLSGEGYIYQQYRQLGTNNKNNSLASANVGHARVLSKLSLKLVEIVEISARRARRNFERDYTLQVLNHSIRNLFVLYAYGNEQAEYNLGDEARIIA